MDKEQKLSDVLKGMMDSMKWKEKLHETTIRDTWRDKMGTTINHHTKEIRYRREKLYIFIESSSLKQELSYEREKIKAMMNRALGGDYVKDVMIR
ncbi:MAG: DUF721 domain-containing protein [Bacteroidota bacterium]